MVQSNRTEQLKKIRDEIVAGKHLPLYKERIKNKVFPVIGEGNHHADIVFIGEAPGKNEAATGKPFCGASGKVLDKLLESAGIHRPEVYVTNIVKDRPPQNRDPLPKEIEAYAPYLDRQLEIIQPKVIATLGRFSMVYIMSRFGLASELKSISQIHGNLYEGTAPWGKIKVMPLYHPAVAVYNNNMLAALQKDIKVLKDKISS
jgi:uracil-DNA glycosylase family 4